eukprot:TRINITY_DN10264_c0_g1_i1.p1 TRINITY_DN10264_c0_g1~~TRINITY_DN10264_c0_g1_i1.p1  ORF type:complete len:300 (-),score=38.54 TRINITY_DN10264_c0_g1_i1:61-960(-)
MLLTTVIVLSAIIATLFLTVTVTNHIKNRNKFSRSDVFDMQYLEINDTLRRTSSEITNIKTDLHYTTNELLQTKNEVNYLRKLLAETERKLNKIETVDKVPIELVVNDTITDAVESRRKKLSSIGFDALYKNYVADFNRMSFDEQNEIFPFINDMYLAMNFLDIDYLDRIDILSSIVKHNVYTGVIIEFTTMFHMQLETKSKNLKYLPMYINYLAEVDFEESNDHQRKYRHCILDCCIAERMKNEGKDVDYWYEFIIGGGIYHLTGKYGSENLITTHLDPKFILDLWFINGVDRLHNNP